MIQDILVDFWKSKSVISRAVKFVEINTILQDHGHFYSQYTLLFKSFGPINNSIQQEGIKLGLPND